jgi:hypothetical protein
MAIQEGIQQAEEPPEETVTLKLSDPDAQMLKKLSASLSLSAKVMVESAMSYAYFYTQSHSSSDERASSSMDSKALQQNPDKPITPSADTPVHSLVLPLSLETRHKLDSLNMADDPSRCAVMGIRLLHDHLIENGRKVATHG